MPTVSVLMPVYNAERYVGAAVKSILAQTYADFEFIVIDDGSTDGSLEILKRYAQQDKRVRLVSRPNTGIVGALNEALALAQGEFIARMDADDISLPERLALQVAYLNSHPECIAVGCGTLWIDADGETLCRVERAESHERIEAAHLMGKGRGIAHATAMIRRDVMIEAGGYRARYEYAEDIDLWLRLAERGRLANLPEVLFKVRRHVQSIGGSRRAEQIRASREMLREAYKRRGLSMSEFPFAYRQQRDFSAAHQHRQMAWSALVAGNIRAARKHALITLRRAPFSLSSWRVLACAIRGH